MLPNFEFTIFIYLFSEQDFELCNFLQCFTIKLIEIIFIRYFSKLIAEK